MTQLVAYVGPNSSPRLQPLAMGKSEILKPAFDWNAYLGYRASATISTSAWESENSSVVSVASATNTGGITGCTVTAVEIGQTTIKNTVALSNGETLIRKRYVRVTDPLAGASLSDYPA